jgi:hypothetical protein
MTKLGSRRVLIFVGLAAICVAVSHMVFSSLFQSFRWFSRPLRRPGSYSRPIMGAPFDVLNANVADLRAELAAGKLTSVDLVTEYLAQIEKHNFEGLGLRALISTAPKDSVLTQARALDAEREEKGPRGPFHGIPILVKVGSSRSAIGTCVRFWHDADGLPYYRTLS